MNVVVLSEATHGPNVSSNTPTSPAPSGLGLTLEQDGYGAPVIVSRVDPNGIAAADGQIRSGDQIVSIDGNNVEGLSVTEVRKMLTSGPEQ